MSDLLAHHEAAFNTLREKLKKAGENGDKVGITLYGGMVVEYQKFISEMKRKFYLQLVEDSYNDE